MAISFDKPNRLIVIGEPQVLVTVQALINAIRDYEDDWFVMDIPRIASASGKEDLGGGTLVGITLKLYGWKIKFADRSGPETISCEITGGNLVAVDYDNWHLFVNPIEPSTFTQVTRTTSASATIASLEIANLQRLIESLRVHHSGYGNMWYWNPHGGSDLLDGTTPEKAVKTFEKAHEYAVDWNHDIIFCMPGNDVGNTISLEPMTITKNYLFIRGPGRDFRIYPNLTNAFNSGIHIGGIGVELSGFLYSGENLGAGTKGFTCDGSNHFLLQNVIAKYSNSDMLDVTNANTVLLDNCYFEHCGGHGVACGDNTEHVSIAGTAIDDCGLDGLHLEGTNIKEVHVKNGSSIQSCAGYGVRIGAGVAHTSVRDSVLFGGNILGDILDGGFDTDIQAEARAIQTANAVFDGEITSHNEDGTFGKLINTVSTDLTLVRGIEAGRWVIDNTLNQMIFYAEDGLTEIKRFDLKDAVGAPTSTSVFERVEA